MYRANPGCRVNSADSRTIRARVSLLRFAAVSTRWSRRPRTAAAFTLVEVLVALAIFAFGAIVLGSSYINILMSYDVVRRNAAINEDVAFARQLVLTEPDRVKLELGGEFDTASGGRARWGVEITSTTTADVFNVAFTCEITTSARPDPEKTTQTFTVLRPTWSIDPAERDKLRLDAKTRILELQKKAP